MAAGIEAFVAFCMVSSVVYIINDICDREKDRKHATKCKRPIAAGTVSVANAWVLTAVLLIAAAICNGLAFHMTSSLLLMIYLILKL